MRATYVFSSGLMTAALATACASQTASSVASGPTIDGGAASPSQDASVAPLLGDASGGQSLLGDAMDSGVETACGLIYLIGQDTGTAPDPSQPVVLYAFDPMKPALTRVGAIPCMSAAEEFPVTAAQCAPPTGGGCSTAMVVDDQGIAWIFTPYVQGSSGAQKVYAVRTGDATCVGAGMNVGAQTFAVTGAALVTPEAPDGGPGPGHTYAVLQDRVAPTGLATFGDFDPSTGEVQGIRPVDPSAEWATNSGWFWTGNSASAYIADWVYLGAWWTAPLGSLMLAIDPNCQGGGCSNQCLDGGPVPNGSPAWQMGVGPFPSSLLPAQKPWTAVWGMFFPRSTNGSYHNDVYYFTPGWWASGQRDVTQLDLTQVSDVNTAAQNEAAVHPVMSDLGVNAFAATAGPQCAPAAVLPPPPPTQ
jgi:hypothetical protein